VIDDAFHAVKHTPAEEERADQSLARPGTSLRAPARQTCYGHGPGESVEEAERLPPTHSRHDLCALRLNVDGPLPYAH